MSGNPNALMSKYKQDVQLLLMGLYVHGLMMVVGINHVQTILDPVMPYAINKMLNVQQMDRDVQKLRHVMEHHYKQHVLLEQMVHVYGLIMHVTYLDHVMICCTQLMFNVNSLTLIVQQMGGIVCQ